MHVQGPKPLDHTQTSLAFITVFFHTRSQLSLQYKNRPFTLGVQNRGRGSVTVSRTKRTNDTKEAESILMFARSIEKLDDGVWTIWSLEDINVIDPDLIACCEDEEDESILIFA
jgi:hypothetical protein